MKISLIIISGFCLIGIGILIGMAYVVWAFIKELLK